MPQIAQLGDVALSQLFWMTLVLGFIYFVIGRSMLPKVLETVDARDAKIADDLKAAEAARDAADAIEESYRSRMDGSRADAAKLIRDAKDKGADAAQKAMAKADAELEAKTSAAMASIHSSRAKALAGVDAAAGDLAKVMVAKLVGLNVSDAAAKKAVKEAANG